MFGECVLPVKPGPVDDAGSSANESLLPGQISSVTGVSRGHIERAHWLELGCVCGAGEAPVPTHDWT